MNRKKEQKSITTAEAAENMGVSARTIRRRCETGALRAKKVNGRYMIEAKSLSVIQRKLSINTASKQAELNVWNAAEQSREFSVSVAITVQNGQPPKINVDVKASK